MQQHEGADERGFVTVQYVAAIALSLLVLVLVANLLVDLYARGAARDALDEGVHAAVSMDADSSACARKADEVFGALVRGPVATARIDCSSDGTWVDARAHVTLPSWLPHLIPDWELDLRARALKEA
jgi:hypothetical protein